MKKMKLAALALALAGVLAAGNAMAADSATLTVSATVDGTCSFKLAGAEALAFGNIDPTSGLDATATTTLTYVCTNGTGYGITVPGTGAIIGPDTINYTLAGVDSGTGTGNGIDQTLDLTATIAAADYATKPAGVYSGTVQIDITP